MPSWRRGGCGAAAPTSPSPSSGSCSAGPWSSPPWSPCRRPASATQGVLQPDRSLRHPRGRPRPRAPSPPTTSASSTCCCSSRSGLFAALVAARLRAGRALRRRRRCRALPLLFEGGQQALPRPPAHVRHHRPRRQPRPVVLLGSSSASLLVGLRWAARPQRWQSGPMNDPRAGQPAQPSDLVDVAHLVTAYYTLVPDPDDLDQQVAFGTSGHRGSSLKTAFNEAHILATTQAICDYRRVAGLRRSAVHRSRHPRPVRAGLGLGARGARRQRRHRARRRPRRLHPDACGEPRDHPRQRGPDHRARPSPTASSSPRRTTRPATAGSSTTRRTVGPPTPTPPRSSPPGPTSSSPAGLDGVRRVPFSRARAHGPALRLPRHLRRRPARRRRPRPRSRRPASASAPTRSAARPSTTGARSPSGTASTSPSSTRSSTRPGGS